MGPGTKFRKAGLFLHLPLGVLRLITHNGLLAFTVSPSSVTVIKQQSVLICGYVRSNQLEVRDQRGGRRERQNEGRKRHIITVFPYFSSTHMALIGTYSHIHNNRHIHAHRLSPSLPVPLRYVGQCESFSWAHVQARHYLLFYTTVQPLSGSEYSSIMALI